MLFFDIEQIGQSFDSFDISLWFGLKSLDGLESFGYFYFGVDVFELDLFDQIIMEIYQTVFYLLHVLVDTFFIFADALF